MGVSRFELPKALGDAAMMLPLLLMTTDPLPPTLRMFMPPKVIAVPLVTAALVGVNNVNCVELLILAMVSPAGMPEPFAVATGIPGTKPTVLATVTVVVPLAGALVVFMVNVVGAPSVRAALPEATKPAP